ncbi:P-loop containing nucleoside triphosphate hydrolase protein [Hypoxylon sp. EC38]|nr:P-loop containing nucleoside triphosphate hydrolase protein [Hypoxylon sp. EC38]
MVGMPLADDSVMSDICLTPISEMLSTTGGEYQTRASSVSECQLEGTHVIETSRKATVTEEPMKLDSEIICFGMICEPKARLLQDMKIIMESGLLSSSFRKNVPIPLRHHIRSEHVILLQLTETKDIAVLDRITTDALLVLTRMQGCQVDFFVDGSQLSSAINDHKCGRENIEFAMKLVVYGPRETKDEVARFLSDAQLYLQHASIMRPGIICQDNPHVLHLGDFAQILTAPTTFIGRNLDEGLEIETLLGDLSHQYELKESTYSKLVASKLKSHQAFAVDFIAQREGRKPLSLPSLWREDRRNGVPCYAHTITGDTKLVADNETVGGILADEMGLGKTLTMLASIVNSLQESRGFAAMGNSPSIANARGTLVIVPSAFLIDEWLSDTHDHLHYQELQILRHHGLTKARSAEELLQYDIVLSTYSTVASDFRSEEPVLYSINWFRVILDEAHCIRHQGIQQSGAVAVLSAKFRWCLTGTPIHNSLSDLGSLVSFLRVPLLQKREVFRTHIAKAVEGNQPHGIEHLRQLLKSICLRRTKELIGLADPKEDVHQVELSIEESNLYKETGEAARAQILEDVCQLGNPKSRGIILQTITRLRRICNHGTMDEDLSKPWSDGVKLPKDGTTESLDLKENMCCLTCPCDIETISDDPGIATGRLTPCQHLLCNDCYTDWEAEINSTKRGRRSRCHLCQGSGPKARTKARKAINNRTAINLSGQSSKIALLVEDIRKHRDSEKCIVFSSWTRTLDIVSQVFCREGIRFGRIDGKLSTGERRKVLEQFQADPNMQTLLMSLGTGAVGLNITAATRVHILEPQWNPSVEKQAIGRALRLGQTRPVTVVKYRVGSSIEEHIYSQQARKLGLSRIGWAENNATQIGSVKNLEDLDNLFGQLSQQ